MQQVHDNLESQLRFALIPLINEFENMAPVTLEDGEINDVDDYILKFKMEYTPDADTNMGTISLLLHLLWGQFEIEIDICTQTGHIIFTTVYFFLLADSFSYTLSTGILTNSFGARMSQELFPSLSPVIDFAKEVRHIIGEELKNV